MNTFPTNSKKMYFSEAEEITSADLNNLSKYLHQIIKDFNVNVFQGQQSGAAYPGCIINGLVVTLNSGVNPTVSVGPGMLLFSLLSTDPTDTNNYSGSIYAIEADTAPTGAIKKPASGETLYAIDIQYNESLNPVTETRNSYSDVSETGGPLAISTTSLNNVTSTLSMVLSTEPPKDGYTRLCEFTVNSSGTLSNLTYILPFIWNLQNWPGTPHSANLDTTHTLADSLSAIRAEISAILGPSSKWYNTPSTDLATAVTDIATLRTTALTYPKGVKAIYFYGVTGAITPFTVPAGIKRLWVRLWGPGGSGGASTYVGSARYAGGGGGGGGYVEDIFDVTPGEIINYFVAAGNSGSPTVFYKTPTSLIAGAGGTGADGVSAAPYYGTWGLGGTASGGSFNVPGLRGGHGGYLYTDTIVGTYAKWGMGAGQAGSCFSPIGGFGLGGYAGQVDGGPGTFVVGEAGHAGALLIYCM
jgi:hypothetical protein